jgi:3-oxoacyl-[acyl-carrier-protein] synthase II
MEGPADFEGAWPGGPAAGPATTIPAEVLEKALAVVPGLGPKLRRTPRLVRLALAALAPLAPRPDDQSQALVLATAYGSAAATFEFMDSLLADGADLASPTAFAHSVSNMAAALVSLQLGLTGPALTVTNFSLAPALEAAAALLAAGGVETVFLGVAEESLPRLAEVEALVERAVSAPVEGAVFFRLGSAGSHPEAARLIRAEAPEAGIEETIPGPLASAWRLARAFRRLKVGAEPDSRPGFPGEKFRLVRGGHD